MELIHAGYYGFCQVAGYVVTSDVNGPNGLFDFTIMRIIHVFAFVL
jgi:hypothetical protein